MIGVAVIGAGHWGPNLIRNFHNHETSHVVCVIDRDRARLELVRQRFRDVDVAEDPARAFTDPAVTAVAIVTPTVTHHALAKTALEAGKHVLVEKPIAASAAQALELCDLARDNGRILMVGHVFVYHPSIQHVREYLSSDLLGQVRYISMVRTNLGPIRTDVNAAWDLAAHDLSIANYWLQATPSAVSALGGAWINPGIEDAVFATLRYPGDVLVNLHVSWLNPRKTRDITVVGTKCMLTFDDMNLNEPLRIYDKQVTDDRSTPNYVDSFATFRASIRDGEIRIPKIAAGEPLRVECEHFLECIRTGSAPLSGGSEGADVVRALEAIARSVERRGAEVPV